MKKTYPLLSSLCALSLAFPGVVRAADNPFETKPPKDSPERVGLGVVLTQVGLMRTLLLLDSTSLDSEKLIAQRLSEAQFRVFPSAKTVTSRLDTEQIKAIGEEAQADLVVYAVASSREKASMGNFKLYEGEATVQVFSPVTGELAVTHTARTTGPRKTDAVEAERAAREAATDLAVKEAIVKSLEKAQKLIVHRAVLTGVRDNTDLLAFMESIAKMKEVYSVRRVSWDPKTKEAVIEIIASPRADSFWRVQIESMPKVKITKFEYVVDEVPAPKPDSGNIPNWLKKN